MVQTTEQAGVVPHLGGVEAERLRHRYLGPEHLLLGLLSEGDDPIPHGDSPAARLLRRHGLDHATVRAEVDRLIAAGMLPGPQPSDAELLASLGIDLEAVERRVMDGFGWQAYYYAAQWVRLRSTHAFPHAPLGGTPLVCWRVLRLAAEEAAARDHELGPEHLLVGLLRDAQEPLETTLDVQDQRLRGLLGLPDHGPHPIRLLVEARGLTLEGLLAAALDELDRAR
jgi:Clp amino terminal domain, pathogenicity island component